MSLRGAVFAAVLVAVSARDDPLAGEEIAEKEVDVKITYDDDGVAIVTNENFQTFSEQNETFLAAFYAPWCEHCKKFMPVYANAPTEFEGTGIAIAKVDGESESQVMQDSEIEGFPTVALFKKGRKYEYTGERELAPLREWAVDLLLPALREAPAAGVQSVIDARKTGERVFVYTGELSGEDYDAVAAVADGERTNAKWVASKGSSPFSLVAYAGLGETMEYSAGAYGSVDEFAAQGSVPKFGKVDDTTFELYLSYATDSLIWACMDPEDVDGVATKLAPVFQQAHDMLKSEGNIKPALVYVDTKEYADHAREELGCSVMDEKFMSVAVNLGDMKGAVDDELRRYVRAFAIEEADATEEMPQLTVASLVKYVNEAFNSEIEEIADRELDDLDADDGDYDADFDMEDMDDADYDMDGEMDGNMDDEGADEGEDEFDEEM